MDRNLSCHHVAIGYLTLLVRRARRCVQRQLISVKLTYPNDGEQELVQAINSHLPDVSADSILLEETVDVLAQRQHLRHDVQP